MDRRQRKTREAIFSAFTALLEKKAYNQITVQEMRWNREGEAELTLQNSGNAITVNITELGNVTLPAYSLQTFRWNLKNN